MPLSDLEFEDQARREHEQRMEALRRQIAEQASRPPPTPGWGASVLQLFLIPMGVAVVSLGIFALVWWVTHQERKSAQDWLAQVEHSQGYERKWALVNLTAALRSDESAAADPATALALARFYDTLPADADEETLFLKVYVLRALAILRRPESVDAVGRWLHGETDEEVRGDCMDTLGAIGAPEGAAPMRPFLRGESALLRKYAAFNLAVLRAPEDRDGVASLLEDAVDDVRWNAAIALALFYADPRGASTVRQLLDRDYVWNRTPADERNPEERDLLAAHTIAMACRAAGALEDDTFAADLRGIAREDPNPDVRAAAQEALRAIEEGSGT